MFRLAFVYTVSLLASASWAGAQAVEIHKWTDEKGITHYSDEKPQSLEIAVTRIEIKGRGDRAEASSRTTDDYYSIANQWQRIQRERLQRENLELQRIAATIDRKNHAEPVHDADAADDTRYVVAYPYPRHRHRHKHRHHHFPPVKPVKSNRSNGFPTTVN